MASRPPTRSPLPRQVNTQTAVLDTHHGRVLCIADIRGHLSVLNDFAREHNAVAIIHTGDFGFFDASSLEPNGINDRTLRHLASYTPFIPSAQREDLNAQSIDAIRSVVNISLLSEFPLLLSGQVKLHVPVYTVWGACEDVRILEKFRQGTFAIDNLHVLDEATTRCIELGGVKLRLLGLGGALVPHKMFDNGDGHATIAGGQGTMWTTALQIGELVDTAQRVYDNTETRVLVTHACPGREGIIAQLALVLKADITISAGLHFRYATSYNEFSVQGDYEGFRRKIIAGKQGFDRVWESVRPQVEAVMDDHQKVLMDKALSVIERVPPVPSPSANEEPAWKNCWNWNLCDAAYGSLVLDIKEGRISADLKSQGFNFAYRRSATTAQTPSQPNATLPPSNISQAPTTVPTPVSVVAVVAVQSPPPPASAPIDKGSPTAKINGTNPNATAEKAEREKAKKKEKKERKERERAEKDKEKKDDKDKKDEKESGTPQSTTTPVLPESGSGVTVSSDAGPKSPVTETGSSGVRTPKTGKPPRHPWTIFMRMPNGFNTTDAEVKLFFGEVGSKIMKIHWPAANPNFAHRAKIAYVDFEDEESMRTGLEKHAEKLNDIVPQVMQATDKETREGAGRGTMRGRGRGGGSYAARGFAAAGLTRGGLKGGNGGSPGDAVTATQAPAPTPAPAPAPSAAET
ncbi:hypothetical protein C0989_002900 [Termitomyces sp. Mn162]|nr:hypothetical protein C0989_002900 [Termitomyces sp. Mn162]